jgi:hypothetical protein
LGYQYADVNGGIFADNVQDFDRLKMAQWMNVML